MTNRYLLDNKYQTQSQYDSSEKNVRPCTHCQLLSNVALSKNLNKPLKIIRALSVQSTVNNVHVQITELIKSSKRIISPSKCKCWNVTTMKPKTQLSCQCDNHKFTQQWGCLTLTTKFI